MENIILSVVIPIYNGEDHLKRTLDSLLSAGVNSFNVEIILVNDGSTDGSLSICEDYLFNYPDLFRLFTKENGGLSSARNLGIENSKGKYIYFFDDDDILRPESLSLFYKNYYNDKYDILGFSSDTVDDSKNVVIEKGLDGSVIFDGSGLDFMKIRTPTFVWIYWYKRDFLIRNNIRFTIRYPEDVLFNLMVFRLSPKVLITGQKAICYMNYRGDGQLTKQRDPQKMRVIIEGYMSYFKELSLSRALYHIDDTAIFLAMQSQIIPFISRCLSSNLSRNEFQENINQLIQLDLLFFGDYHTKLTRVAMFIIKTKGFFPFYKLFYRQFFLRFILPRLSRA